MPHVHPVKFACDDYSTGASYPPPNPQSETEKAVSWFLEGTKNRVNRVHVAGEIPLIAVPNFSPVPL